MSRHLSNIEREFLIGLLGPALITAQRALQEDGKATEGKGPESDQLEAHAKMVEGLLYHFGASPGIPLIGRIRGALLEPEVTARRQRSNRHNANAATFLRVSNWPCDLDLGRVGLHFDAVPGSAAVRIRLAGMYEWELELHREVDLVDLPSFLESIPLPLSWKELVLLGFKSVMPGRPAPQVGP